MKRIMKLVSCLMMVLMVSPIKVLAQETDTPGHHPFTALADEAHMENPALRRAFEDYLYVVENFHFGEFNGGIPESGASIEEVRSGLQSDQEPELVEVYRNDETGQLEQYLVYQYQDEAINPSTDQARGAELVLFFSNDKLIMIAAASLDYFLDQAQLPREAQLVDDGVVGSSYQDFVDRKYPAVAFGESQMGGARLFQVLVPGVAVADEADSEGVLNVYPHFFAQGQLITVNGLSMAEASLSFSETIMQFFAQYYLHFVNPELLEQLIPEIEQAESQEESSL